MWAFVRGDRHLSLSPGGTETLSPLVYYGSLWFSEADSDITISQAQVLVQTQGLGPIIIPLQRLQLDYLALRPEVGSDQEVCHSTFQNSLSFAMLSFDSFEELRRRFLYLKQLDYFSLVEISG